MADTASAPGLRAKLYRQLEPDARDSGISPLNVLLVGLVLISFIALAVETERSIPQGWKDGLGVFNIAILAIFAAEYLTRLWIAGEDPRYRGIAGRLRYMVTPFALADLVAFLPELLWIAFMPLDGNEQAVMGLRVLRLARLLKIARFVPAFGVLGATLRRAGSQLLTSLALAMALLYVAAMTLYFIEGDYPGQEAAFGSIPRAIWWAVATLTTVGYGDVYPVTPLGRLAAGIIAIAGIGLVALPAGVFASAFSDELRTRAEEKAKRRLGIDEEGGGEDG